MPVKSYLVYPSSGKFDELKTSLHQLPYCEVLVPKNSKELLVVISDTLNDIQETQFNECIQAIPELNQLILISGFDDQI